MTETFVLNEIRVARLLGTDTVIYPLRRDRMKTVHPGVNDIADAVRYTRFASLGVAISQCWWLWRSPRRYLSALVSALVGTWGSVRFFAVAFAIFPKVAHMARRMQREGVTHVHCHFATHPALAGFIIRRLTGLPYSFTAHGSDLLKDRHMLPQKVQESHFVVAISRYNRDLIVSECRGEHREKIHVIHCGVDVAAFPVATRPRRANLSILCVGRIAPWKGQLHLVEACRQLEERGVVFRCRFVGDGEDSARLRGLIERLRLGSRVMVAGWMTHPEVAMVMREADVLVAPSAPANGKKEGIPVTLMEGMSTGLAVVASDITGIPELVKHERTGLLVPPADPEALADALQRLFVDTELRGRLGVAARKHVQQEFDLRANTAALLSLITGQS